MNRNSESHFSQVESINMQRSRMDRSSGLKTTMDASKLIPIYVDDILPGDSVTMDMSTVIRMATPIYPVMDNCFADFYFFFVPNRLTWEHWREFMGENRLTHWEQAIEYEIPQLTAPAGGWAKGTIADYMGLPTYVDGISVSALPFRAYGLIWNEWFRDQNLKDPCMVNIDDTTRQGKNSGDYKTTAQLGAEPLKVAKVHDYYTSALPAPQKGESVLLPLGTEAPVYGRPQSAMVLQAGTNALGIVRDDLQLSIPANGAGPTVRTPEGDYTGHSNRLNVNIVEKSQSRTWGSSVYADLTDATAATINQLRQAFAIQRMLERDARGGSRYTEILRSHFSVISPDARQQRPEYLGGHRLPINISQVVQTSGQDAAGTPTGNTGAYSLTTDSGSVFTKSFTEHGYLIGVMCIRTDHTYQQGIEKHWSRRNRYDFYWPSLAHLGETAILNKELYAQGNAADEEAFGYQEAWAEYRYKPSRVTGAFRSNTPGGGLDSWHYADYYTQQPILGSEWIDETQVNIDRTLAVQSELENQFICDFYFKCGHTRVMPVYSVPGLIDHY